MQNIAQWTGTGIPVYHSSLMRVNPPWVGILVIRRGVSQGDAAGPKVPG